MHGVLRLYFERLLVGGAFVVSCAALVGEEERAEVADADGRGRENCGEQSEEDRGGRDDEGRDEDCQDDVERGPDERHFVWWG